MRAQLFVPRSLSIVFTVGFLLLFTIMPISAQDEAHPPQFLYRDGEQLILVNGETGDTTTLVNITATEYDHYEWSPDGHYLLGLQHEGENRGRCLNLYDVNEVVWIHDNPLACDVEDAAFSHDATQLAYSTSDDVNSTLWLHTLENSATAQLSETTEGEQYFLVGIIDIRWSPGDTYLTFMSYKEIMGGPLNTLVVRDIDRGTEYLIIGGRSGYYAIYDPIWSPSEEWFLLGLQEEYVTSGANPYTNHRGDLYLVHAVDGQQYRLTYTPTIPENNIKWTVTGSIAYDTVQHNTLSVQDALSIPVPSLESIVTPEPIEPLERIFRSGYPAPGEDFLFAWVEQSGSREGGLSTTLNIGLPRLPDNIVFTAQLPENYRSTNTIIGWRP